MSCSEVKYGNGTTPLACPRCGSGGKKVKPETVASLVKGQHAASFCGEFRLCLSPHCPVVYFAGNDLIFTVDDVRVPVWFKTDSADVPVCYCKGVTRRQIRQAVADGARTLNEVKEATGACGGGQCLTQNPGGT